MALFPPVPARCYLHNAGTHPCATTTQPTPTRRVIGVLRRSHNAAKGISCCACCGCRPGTSRHSAGLCGTT